MSASLNSSVHTVDDGFGNAWECRHGLGSEWCCMEVVRPGKQQCVCDAGLAALLDHFYERGKDDEWEAHRYNGWDSSGDW